ncbi:MAG TPA: DUF3108 domain-containing protein [Moraxellaceae bacterium]|nr:DUF3108 domain-containing protein [Moraxellaceae bacterium]
MLRLVTLGLLLLLGSSLAQALELKPFVATYQFNLDDKLKGTATRTLERRGPKLWNYTFAASAPFASASETSDFTFDGRVVQPMGYQQVRNIVFSKKRAAIAFDWRDHKGTGTRDDKPTVTYPLVPGTLDEINMEIQIRRDLVELGKLAGPYTLATPKDAAPLEFVVEGTEVITTPYGKLTTLRVSRKHTGNKRHTTFWLAREFDYLPARVVQNDGGMVYSLELSSVDYPKASN